MWDGLLLGDLPTYRGCCCVGPDSKDAWGGSYVHGVAGGNKYRFQRAVVAVDLLNTPSVIDLPLSDVDGEILAGCNPEKHFPCVFTGAGNFGRGR